MNNIIVKDEKIHAIIDLGDVIYSFTIFDFSVSLCYLILHEFRNNNAKLSDVKIKSFVDAYENQYQKLNNLELSVIHVSISIMAHLFELFEIYFLIFILISFLNYFKE